MGNDIKPIETIYNGYKFRSSLEARWAVFFDAAGIRYEYEPEGFRDNKGLCYLPDFYLPDENMYVEVKAHRKGIWREMVKAIHFVGSAFPSLMFLSDIPSSQYSIWTFPVVYFHPVNLRYEIRHLPFIYSPYGEECVVLERELAELDKEFDADVLFDEFGDCDEKWNDELAERILTQIPDKEGFAEDFYYCAKNRANVNIVRNAFDKARKARFEFGEKGG